LREAQTINLLRLIRLGALIPKLPSDTRSDGLSRLACVYWQRDVSETVSGRLDYDYDEMTIAADRPKDLHQICFVSGRLSTRFSTQGLQSLYIFAYIFAPQKFWTRTEPGSQ
jgi:hypothetical protein